MKLSPPQRSVLQMLAGGGALVQERGMAGGITRSTCKSPNERVGLRVQLVTVRALAECGLIEQQHTSAHELRWGISKRGRDALGAGATGAEFPPLSEAQQLHFALLRLAWGDEGTAMIADLLDCRASWQAAVGEKMNGLGRDLRKLRDLASTGDWHIDALYVWCASADAEPVMAALAERWSADEFTFYDTKRRDDDDRIYTGTSERAFVARFWWD